MRVKFVAGFGPLVRDRQASLAFYRDTLGLGAPRQHHVHALDALICTGAGRALTAPRPWARTSPPSRKLEQGVCLAEMGPTKGIALGSQESSGQP